MGIARRFQQTVTLETYLGSGAYGDVYADAATVACFVDDSVKLVRNKDGNEIVSSTTIYAPVAAAPASPPTAGQFAAGSRVTVNDRIGYVITANRRDSTGPAAGFHVAVTLT